MADKPVMIGLTPTIVVDNRFHVIAVIAITPADNTDGGVAATANIDIPCLLTDERVTCRLLLRKTRQLSKFSNVVFRESKIIWELTATFVIMWLLATAGTDDESCTVQRREPIKLTPSPFRPSLL